MEELPDPTGLMHLVFIGKVVSGKGEFCVQYDDGTKMVRTAAQSLGHGTFGLQVSLPCIPSETILYLDATHPKKPLLIESASLYIMTARMPEPSTIGLLALALGGVLLRRRG